MTDGAERSQYYYLKMDLAISHSDEINQGLSQRDLLDLHNDLLENDKLKFRTRESINPVFR